MDRYCYVIENVRDAANNFNRWTTVNPIIVNSVQDMVHKVIRRVGRDVLANLYIAGHGFPGYQSVGFSDPQNPDRSDLSGAYSIYFDEGVRQLYGDADRHLVLLRPLFRRSSIVTLGACNVAAESIGRQLLSHLSRLWGGISVQGSTEMQDALPGMEGDVIRCGPSRCQTFSSTYWGSPGGGWIN